MGAKMAWCTHNCPRPNHQLGAIGVDLAASDWVLLLERLYDFQEVIVNWWLGGVGESPRVYPMTNLPFRALSHRLHQ